MQFGRKHLLAIFVIAVVLTSAFIWQDLPTLGLNPDVSGVVADTSYNGSNATKTDGDQQNKSVTESSVEPSYRRGRDFERWAYPNRTVCLVQYMGPRFVRHYATGQFVDLVFEDYYASKGYYLVQNAYIGLKIYDNRTVMYNPDMEYVAVEEEFFNVQVYDEMSTGWLDLGLGKPFLRVNVENLTTVMLTRVYDSSQGRLEASYIIKAGEFMKYNIDFTSFSEAEKQFRLIHSLIGICGTKLRYITDSELSSEIVNVTAPVEFTFPFFGIGTDDVNILTVNLYDLGSWNMETGGWSSSILKGVLLENHTRGLKARITIGNYTLRQSGGFSMDPLVTTIPILHGLDDTYEYEFEQNSAYRGHLPSSNILVFGNKYCKPDYSIGYHYMRTYLRWPILIPEGATVKSAYIHLRVYTSSSSIFTAKIKVVNKADCPQFTDASAPWNWGVLGGETSWQIDSLWTAGYWVASPNITDRINEFMNMAGYTLGNYIGLRISEGDAAHDEYREVYSYNGGASSAPKLEITFTYPYNETFVEPIENWSFEDSSSWELSWKVSSVGTSTVTSATVHDWQRKAFYAQGRFWVFYSDGASIVYRSSSDGVSWSSSTTVDGNGGYGGKRISIHWDGTYVSYVLTGFQNNQPVYYRRGTPNANGNITWDPLRTASPAESYAGKDMGTVTKDSNGYPWIAYTKATFGSRPIALKATATDGSSWGTEVELDSTSDTKAPTILPLLSGKMYAIWCYSSPSEGSRQLRGKYYDGSSWGNLTTIDTNVKNYDRYSATVVSGVIYLVYLKGTTNHLAFRSWTQAGGWTNETILESGQSADATPAITGNLTSGDLYVFWNNGAQMRLKKRIGGVWKASMDLASPTSVTSNSHSVSAYLHVYSGKIGCIWLEGSSSPYTVKHASNPAVQLDSTTYMHGKRSWYVQGSQSQDIFIEQALSSEVVEYIRNRKAGQNRGVCFSFWYKPDSVNSSSGEKNKAYAQIQYYNGSWHTESGDTVKPTEDGKWCMAQVHASLPTTTTQAMVRITGIKNTDGGFQARIDLASLSVYYYVTKTDTQGNVTLTTNIYYSNAIPHPEFDGFVSLGFGIAAKAKEGYSVAKLKDLKVELLPNNGSATTQAGRLMILYFSQTNAKNHTIDPQTQQELINSAMATGQLVLDAVFIIGDVVFTVATMGVTKIGQLVAATVAIGVGEAWLSRQINRETVHNPLAEGGTSYKVWETLDYSDKFTGPPYASQDDRISDASAQYYFDWRFRTDSEDIFAIKISGTVEWYEWDEGDPYNPNDDQWVYAGESKLSFVISLANYWQ